MSPNRLGLPRSAALLALSALTLGAGLGSSGRLTYHEAIVAQAAREMIGSGDLLTPTVGGRPWLEKPPLAVWLVAASGRAAGGVGEASARFPSATAAGLLVLGVGLLAAGRFGPSVGLLAGLVQATTVWTVVRGRLAEADILLACLVTWTFLALDSLRGSHHPGSVAGTGDDAARRTAPLARWGVFAGIGLMSLAKGVGFGAALVAAAAVPLLLLDGDRKTLRSLMSRRGWLVAAGLTLAWPMAAAVRHPSALGLWSLHVTDRLSERPAHFIGQTGPEYLAEILGQLLPWAPLAAVGAWRSAAGALGRRGRYGGDRLLWAWAVGPLALLSLATVKNAHYAIHALPPFSVWAALGLTRLAHRLQTVRGWTPPGVRRLAVGGFIGLGLAFAVGFAGLGPWFDRRGVEWAFYERAARQLRPGEPVSLLYHVPDWDRKPYETPFGPVPHDYAVRLFYLNRPDAVPCRFGIEELAAERSVKNPGGSFTVIGRPVDAEPLARFGRVETLARGPDSRADRTYLLYRVTPEPAVATLPPAPARR